MKTSESIKNVSMSFVKASNLVKNMIPDSKGYGYNYTSLGPIIDQIKPILSDHSLCVIQSPAENENSLAIETVILHESGEYLSFIYNISATNMKGANNTQQEGAAISYGRRYALSAIFGIATETDTDAAYKKEDKKQETKKPPVKIGEDPFKEKYVVDDKIKASFTKCKESQKLTAQEIADYIKRYKAIESHEDAVLLLVEMEGIVDGR